MTPLEPRQNPHTVPDELLSVLVDEAVRRIRPIVSDADLNEVRAVMRSACEGDPVLLLLLQDSQTG